MFPDDWSGRRVAVLGLGVTGFSIADTLAELGARVEVIAGRDDPERQDILGVLGVPVTVVADPEAQAARLRELAPEAVFFSPGFHPDHPAILEAGRMGVPSGTDIDLAWHLDARSAHPAKWLCVTGTNGKTTTVQLATAMVRESGLEAAYAGNIGLPVLDVLRDPNEYRVLVLELSSYQLHYLRELSPWASVCLNIAEDHLDWHGSFDAYIAAKGKVYQGTQVACLYNRHDNRTRELVERADVVEGCRAVGFGLMPPGPSDLGVVDGVLCDRAFDADRFHQAGFIADQQALAASGLAATHLELDVLAAAGLARSVGAGLDEIQRAIAAFRPDHHRIEPVADVDGVLWIDDSKATNAHAAAASLAAFDSIVWIVGGLLKGVDITPLLVEYRDRLRGAVVIGTDQSLLHEAFERHASGVPVVFVSPGETGEVMDLAVRAADEMARPGDVVLLAPAAASMDQFASYADRGERFAEAVDALHREARSDEDGPGHEERPAQEG